MKIIGNIGSVLFLNTARSLVVKCELISFLNAKFGKRWDLRKNCALICVKPYKYLIDNNLANRVRYNPNELQAKINQYIYIYILYI